MKPSAPASAVPPQDEEPAELARFRAEWKAELQRRKLETTSNEGPSASSSNLPVGFSSGSSTAAKVINATTSQSQQGSSKKQDALNYAGTQIAPQLSRSSASALSIYRQAVQHEQRAELDDALRLYRQAFRIEPNVDRVYHREEMITAIKQGQNIISGAVSNPPVDPIEGLSAKPNGTLLLTAGKAIVTGTLAGLISAFSENLKFEPEIEGENTPISLLPDEILVMILCKLEPTSIERFARVNRKARILSLDPVIWRELVTKTYKPPQVVDMQEMLPVIEKYMSDFRRVYVEHPRIRLDGVYIATCHYIRPGLSENSWVNVTHLITYHRYVRFFPSGQVLSLLANEEHGPEQIIPLLKPTLRMKGLFIGTWSLTGTTVDISNLFDASGRFPLPDALDSTSTTNSATTDGHTRYVFAMSLDLRSRPLGRWNRLDIQEYNSIKLETGDISPVALKHERPFWFSKVRSYPTI